MTDKQHAQQLRRAAKAAHESALFYEHHGHLHAAEVAASRALAHAARAEALENALGSEDV